MEKILKEEKDLAQKLVRYYSSKGDKNRLSALGLKSILQNDKDFAKELLRDCLANEQKPTLDLIVDSLIIIPPVPEPKPEPPEDKFIQVLKKLIKEKTYFVRKVYEYGYGEMDAKLQLLSLNENEENTIDPELFNLLQYIPRKDSFQIVKSNYSGKLKFHDTKKFSSFFNIYSFFLCKLNPKHRILKSDEFAILYFKYTQQGRDPCYLVFNLKGELCN